MDLKLRTHGRVIYCSNTTFFHFSGHHFSEVRTSRWWPFVQRSRPESNLAYFHTAALQPLRQFDSSDFQHAFTPAKLCACGAMVHTVHDSNPGHKPK
ncbi:hypothetical protein CYMTET_30030 [Cymbomonas tetramitiformis]|uniref:Uncharacterized protein n=1 Tax=Cymbomonas tetramitiformis TaxID=36881 RepID=A0AAE0KUK0_9CHLO|nr:hypothetical protein CYMTET_30030 [Cymbomonas tetramitiformis]